MAVFQVEDENTRLTPNHFDKKKMKTYFKKANR